MKKSLRAFGIGVFIIGAVWTLHDEYFPDSMQVSKLQNDLEKSQTQIADLQQQLQEKNNPKIEAAVEAETTIEEQPESVTLEAPENKTDDVVTGAIFVYEGVSLYDIGKQAEDLRLVENGRELELFLYKPEYSRSIQKGQFELSSDMTLEEMALTLTGKLKH